MSSLKQVTGTHQDLNNRQQRNQKTKTKDSQRINVFSYSKLSDNLLNIFGGFIQYERISIQPSLSAAEKSTEATKFCCQVGGGKIYGH